MGISFWYCVNGGGQAKLFINKPDRDERRMVWVGAINSAVLRFFHWLETDCGYAFPELTWLDDPVRIDMEIEPYEET